MQKRKQYFLISITVAILAWAIWPVSAMADIGPKPTLEIWVTGYNNSGDYYLDLLVSDLDPNVIGDEIDTTPGIENESIFQYSEGGLAGKLCHSEEFFHTHGDLRGQQTGKGYIRHEFTGYPPETFKIIIQDRKTGALKVSNTVNTWQLDSYVQYDAAANRAKILIRHELSRYWLFFFLMRLIRTIIIEWILVLPFRFKKRRWLPLPVNTLTQVFLNVGLVWLLPTLFLWQYFVSFFILEFIVMGIEFTAYYFWMGERRLGKTLAYTLTANGITMALGLLLRN